ncbi:hypothetical protein [Nocardioides plantarum]|uniref:Uncharacterized protein n=1 Tax=Nocardioides plantarum TaxID=29299 RepID=A0ABV5K691_9ACTN|nr:hypothetical protein [Nocardioides plantarum]
MRPLPVAAVVLGTLVSSLSMPVAPAFSDLAPTASTSASDIDLDAPVPGSLLPGRPRLPNGARFLGADESYVLYNTGHLDPTTGELGLTLATRFDGIPVRQFEQAGSFTVRYADGYVLTSRASSDNEVDVTREEARTGDPAGSIDDLVDVVAVDDEWVMTADQVFWFDGRPPVALSASLDDHVQTRQVLGDSDLAVLSSDDGSDPVVVTPGTGLVTEVEHGSERIRVLAARGGSDPVLWGRHAEGLVRWTDPAHDAGRTDVPSDLVPSAGGLAGDRLLGLLGPDGARWISEIDPVTGRAGPVLVPDAGAGFSSGDAPIVGVPTVQAGDELVVSVGPAPEGDLVAVAADGVRTLGGPTPSLLAARGITRAGNIVRAAFGENGGSAGEAELDLGALRRRWTPVDASTPPPVLPPDPPSAPIATCADGAVPKVDDVRGRWQLEKCAGTEHYVTDRHGVLAPHRLPGLGSLLGADHVLSLVGEGSAPSDRRYAVVVTTLDARHLERVYGPLSSETFDLAVDATGDGDPIYVDPAGQIRIAHSSGLADRQPPVIKTTRRLPTYVATVRPGRLDYAATATDSVDGGAVTIRVDARRTRDGKVVRTWSTLSGSSDGAVSVATAPGDEWCFRTVAADRTGNSTTAGAACSLAPRDDTALRVTGSATRARAASYLGGSATVVRGTRPGVAVPAGRGKTTYLWLRTGPNLGNAAVFAGSRRLMSVRTTSARSGVRVVAVRTTGRALTVRATTARPVAVDAYGYGL